MRKFILCSALLGLLTGYASANDPFDKFGFIDLERVFNEFYKTKQAKSRIEVQQQEVSTEQKVITDEMRAISNDADTLKKEARDNALSDEIRDSKRQLYEERVLALRAKQKEAEAFVSRRQQQLQAQSVRMSEMIREEIRHTIIDYAKAGGYWAVLDNASRRSVGGISEVLYNHPDLDITEAILNILNSKCPDLQKDGGLFEEEKKPVNRP